MSRCYHTTTITVSQVRRAFLQMRSLALKAWIQWDRLVRLYEYLEMLQPVVRSNEWRKDAVSLEGGPPDVPQCFSFSEEVP